jgi:DNA-directed RNA polymerase subunit RPC12/RpoP
MKTAKEVLDGTRTLTLITCTVCGNEISVKGRSANGKAQAALSQKIFGSSKV